MKTLREAKMRILACFQKIAEVGINHPDFWHRKGLIEGLCWAYELPIGEDNFIQELTRDLLYDEQEKVDMVMEYIRSKK